MRSMLGQQQQNVGLGSRFFSNKDDLVYRHFSGLGHLGLEDDSKQLIDRVSGEEAALRVKKVSGPIG